MTNPLSAVPDPRTLVSFEEKELSIDLRDAGVRLSGTLTLPLSTGKHPLVILISGSGAADRDSTFLNHKPFRIIAVFLAQKGIAVFRFDKRGVGTSTGDVASATSEILAQDVLALIEVLKGRDEVNPLKIGLIGHSEGGLVAVMAAAQSNDVAFIVMMAGPVVSGQLNAVLVFTLLVNENDTQAQDVTKDTLEFSEFFNIVSKVEPTLEEKKKTIEIARRMLPRITEDTKAAMGFSQVTPEIFVNIFSIPWMQEYLQNDPESFLKKVTCPVLAIYGSKDVQVPAKENIKALEKALKHGKGTDHTIKEIPDLNHLFQICETGYPSEYGTIKQTISPNVLDLLVAWISEKIK